MVHLQRLLLALALSCWALSVAGAAPVLVSSPAELLGALQAASNSSEPGAAVIELQRDVTLSAGDFRGLALPYDLPTGTVLTITGGGGEHSLDFGDGGSAGSGGGLPLVLLSLQPGSALVLDRLNISGTSSPEAGKAELPTWIETSPVWPTIDAAPGAALNITNSNVQMYPNKLCSPEQIALAARNIAALAGRADAAVPDGLTGRFTALSLQLPVANASGAAVGTISYFLDITNITCTPVAPSNASEPGDTAAPVLVSTAAELLAALQQATAAQGADSSTVELTSSIALTAEDAANLTLPLVVGANRTLELRGGMGGALPTLDFGSIPELLYMDGGSRIIVQDLNITGVPHYALLAAGLEAPVAAPVVQAPTRAAAFHLYPTINGAPGFEADIRNVNFTLPPSSQCSEEQVAQQAEFVQQQTGNLSAVWAEGLTLHVVSNTANLPVLSATTGKQVGTMLLRSEGTNSTCTRTASSSSTAAAAGSADDSGGGGTPAWVWAIVAVAACAAVAAGVGALLWRRHRRRRRVRLDDKAAAIEEAGGDSLGKESATGGARQCASTSQQASAHTSEGVLDSHGSGETKADSLMRARVGFIEGLTLGGVLGGGAQGKVYKGRWRGTPVAVKVIQTTVVPEARVDLNHESMLSTSLSHPNVCQSYKSCVVQVLPDAGGHDGCGIATDSASSPMVSPSTGTFKVVSSLTDRNTFVRLYEAWIVSEFADRGSLADALKGGLLKGGAERDMPATMLCLLDIARGLEFLHSCNIVHGDIKPHNVLIKTENRDRRGYVCKLADFGLSHLLGEEQTHVQTASWGTVSHAAPELLRDSWLTKKADIYALGLVMWACLTGAPAYEGIAAMRIIHLVTTQQHRLPIPPDVPEALADLIRRCWAEAAADRPDASQVVKALAAYGTSISPTAAARKAARSAQ